MRFSLGILLGLMPLHSEAAGAPDPLVIAEPQGTAGGMITFADPGANMKIAVTLDGSEPREEDAINGASSFNISQSTTVKARVFGQLNVQPSHLWVKRYPVTFYEFLGPIRPRHAREIASSNWSVGFDNLPSLYDDEKYYPALGALGVKSVRIRSEWAKTEKSKGVYDWTWLDNRVNGLVAQGIKPWINVSFGNSLYGSGAPFTGSEAAAAWDAWLAAMVERYKDQVSEWEIWESPEDEMTAISYANFVARSAAVIRTAQPDGKVIVLALNGSYVIVGDVSTYVAQFFVRLRTLGVLNLIDEVSYHHTAASPESTSLRNILSGQIQANADTRHLVLRQGAAGAPSDRVSSGPMMGYQWNERMQAKWNLRRMMSDRGADIPSSLHAVLNESDLGLVEDLYPDTGMHLKSSYAAFQNVAAIFDGRVERVPSFTTSLSSSTFVCHGYRRTDIDKALVVAWHRSLMPDGAVNPVRSADFTVSSRFSEPVLVDLLTGYVQALPQSVWSSDESGTSFVGLRLSDYPLVIAEREAVLPAYDRWANERFGDLGLVDVNMSAPLADQDGDGVVNLLAFATAREAGDKGPPVTIVPKGDRHALAFHFRGAAGVDYVVEGSSNLKDWNPVARLPKGGVWQLEEGASVLGASLGDGINEVQVSDTDAGAAEEKRFLRLRVE